MPGSGLLGRMELAKLPQLRTLDLSGNMQLKPIQPGTTGIPPLAAIETLGLAGTDLSSLQAGAFDELFATLKYLDLSAPQKMPSARVTDGLLRGAGLSLTAVMWYTTACPQGFSTASGTLPLQADTVLCTR